jgi:small GTP-binding protein
MISIIVFSTKSAFFNNIRLQMEIMGQNKIFICGLDRAGKTVISLYMSKGIIDMNTRPTLAFQTHQLIHPKIKATIFDAPGQIKLRNLWADNVKESKVLIFVLDTADAPRFEEAKKELFTFLKKCYSIRAPLLFVFHKMDLPEAKANLKKATEFFDLQNIYKLIEFRNIDPITIYSIESNVKDPKSLDDLRERIYQLIIRFDLDEDKRKREGKK